jgi:hypothetical protein
LQLLAWFEANRLSRRNGDLGTRTRVAANARLPRPHVEDAEAAQFYSITLGESLLHRLKDCLDSHFRLRFGYAGAVYNLVNDIQLDQETSRPNCWPFQTIARNLDDIKAFSRMSTSVQGRTDSCLQTHFLPRKTTWISFLLDQICEVPGRKLLSNRHLEAVSKVAVNLHEVTVAPTDETPAHSARGG